MDIKVEHLGQTNTSTNTPGFSSNSHHLVIPRKANGRPPPPMHSRRKASQKKKSKIALPDVIIIWTRCQQVNLMMMM